MTAPDPDLRTRMTEAAKDAFADDVRPDGARLFTDERQRHPWRALDDAMAAVWDVISPQLQTPAGAPAPAGPAPDRLRAALSLIRRRTRRMAREWEADRAALIAIADAHDRLRATVTHLADEWDTRAGRYLAWRDHHHERGDETTARISRVRADMCTRHAERLRALLEEM